MSGSTRLVMFADHIIQRRRHKEDARRAHQEKVNYFKEAEVKAEFERRTDRRIENNTFKSRLHALEERDEAQLNHRRQRLASLYMNEERVLKEKVAATYETPEQRVERMRERAAALKAEREAERAAYAQEQKDRQWRDSCDSIRHLKSRKMQAQVNEERRRQIQEKQAQRMQAVEEEAAYARQWEENRLAKEAREQVDRERQQALTRNMMGVLDEQMAVKAAKKARQEELRAEEHALLVQQWELEKEAEQRKIFERRQRASARREELDYYNQLSLARRQEEQRREREMDIRIINELMEAERGQEERELAVRRALKAEAAEYREHLQRQMIREKEDDAIMERMRQEQQEKEWAKRQRQWDREARAREKLMAEVYEARREQIRRKLEQKALERQEAMMSQSRALNDGAAARAEAEYEARQQREKERAYRESLLQQAEYRRRLREDEAAREAREIAELRAQEEAYERRLAQELERDVDVGDHRRTRSTFTNYNYSAFD